MCGCFGICERVVLRVRGRNSEPNCLERDYCSEDSLANEVLEGVRILDLGSVLEQVDTEFKE